MKNTSKILCLVLALVMMCACAMTMSSCSNANKTYTVGISQLVAHPALDAATQGFKDALVKELGEDKVSFIEQNAANDTATCATIANDFVTKKVDLILANATAALQACVNATETIPVLGTSITDYASALGLKDFKGTVGGNISGTSDLAPLDGQADMIVELFPSAKKVALLYCSAESNSKFQCDNVQSFLEKKGLECKTFTFTDSNDVIAVATAAASYADVIYVPTDNTAANCAESIGAAIGNTPIIAGEEGICKGCGVATLSINYYDLGYATGLMAAKILKGEAKVAEMPIEYAPKFTKMYNAARCTELGITIPEGYTAIAN